jgi:hypothetical protein
MSDKTDRLLKLFALAVIVLIVITGVYAVRGLHSDGPAWLIEMLPRGGFYIFDSHRSYAQALVQAPVALAIWLGTVDLNTLIRVHSFGFVGVPVVFWLGALALQFGNRLFWFFLMAFTVSYLRSNFFAAGEYSLAYAMTAFCTSVLLRQQLGVFLASLMLLTGVALTHSYEASLFLGTFLAMLSVVRLWKVPTDTRGTKIMIGIAFVIFLMAVYVGVRSAFFQRSYDGQSVANLGAITEIHLLYLLSMPVLLVSLCIEYGRQFHKWLYASVVLLAALYLLYAFRWDHRNISYGYYSYAYRVLCCFLLLGVLSLASAWRFWPQLFNIASRSASSSRYLSLGSIAFFMSMAWLMLYHTYGYYQWAQRFEQTAISIKVHTPIDQTTINKNHGLNHGYNWMWGNAFTSILLRGNAEAIVLNNSTFISPEPSIYDNLDLRDPLGSNNQATYNKYPLAQFEKKSLLFPLKR